MPSYPEAPRRTGVPRDVLRWLQSLDLSCTPKNFRRDFSNGYITAEIFYWYYPEDIQLHSFDNGTSLATKLGNWSQLEKFFLKRTLNVSKELIDGTIHCKPGAAEILLQEVYVMLTNRRIKTVQDNEVDFTDRHYQDKLPMVARSTATKAVKSNITLSETLAEPDIIINQQKVQAVINLHLLQRQEERLEDPKRFNMKPSLGERAIRLPPPLDHTGSGSSLSNRSASSVSSSSSIRSKSNVTFKEIKVKQRDRSYVSSSRTSTASSSTS
ncbi:PREDICTED: spermatogenesis-associated protein 4 [Nanorana parkeri]|uniref:spermatogenesis-associated protein 4 n=1 Tax=Nanorana parkeri TaxID=125878 RepID=UPI000854C5A7|nr:PREDICTED: spermatogenesis-associated protein 4 [Nanorana parkeri]